MERSQNNIRDIIKNKRNQLSSTEIVCRSQNISTNVEALLDEKYRRADSFLCYYPIKSEVNLIPLYKILLNKGAKLYFPKTYENDICFYEIRDFDNDFIKGKYNIDEPKEGLVPFNYETDTICFTPGLVFDRRCNRMGYGAGYYDRFFAKNPYIIKFGIGFDFQISDNIFVHEKDVPLDYIVTENAIFKRNK